MVPAAVRIAAHVGAKLHGDTSDTLTTIPRRNLRSTYIETASVRGGWQRLNLMSFTVNVAVTSYVLYNDNYATTPSLLTSDFSDTGDNIVTTKSTFGPFTATISAGTLSLGENSSDGTNLGMYGVLIVPVL